MDWHWWGKLNPKGAGAVVVLRGSSGSDRRQINIPWVAAKTQYRVTALFTGRDLGRYSGGQLQAGAIALTLPQLGQEILEIDQL